MRAELPVRRSARLVILDEADRLLLFEYRDEHQPPFWATPGGELLPGESYQAAARRELLEETGLDGEIGPHFREREAVYAVARSGPALWRERYFWLRAPSAASLDRQLWTEEERETIQRWRWWPVASLLSEAVNVLPEWLPQVVEERLTKG